MKTNHPAHGPVSLDRLHQISEILSKAAAQSDGGNLGYAMADAVKVIDGAIAAFGAEPVAWIVHARTGDQLTTDGNYVANAEGILGLHSTPLYTAPPAPVANSYPLLGFVNEYIESWDLGMAGDSGLLASAKQAIADSTTQQPAPVVPDDENGQPAGFAKWANRNFATNPVGTMTLSYCEDAWRAAMIKGAEPVSNRDELPLNYLHGHKDGLEWAAQLAEANHPHTGDWLYDDPIELAKAIRKGPDMPEADGNSPVIPDGWVMVPVDMTPEQMRAVQIKSELGSYAAENLSGAYALFREFWDEAVAAAPQQEAE